MFTMQGLIQINLYNKIFFLISILAINSGSFGIKPIIDLNVTFSPHVKFGKLESKLINIENDRSLSLDFQKLDNYYNWMPGAGVYAKFGSVYNISFFIEFIYNKGSHKKSFFNEVKGINDYYTFSTNILQTNVGLDYLLFNGTNYSLNVNFGFSNYRHLYEIEHLNNIAFDSLVINLNGITSSCSFLYETKSIFDMGLNISFEYTNEFQFLNVSPLLKIGNWESFDFIVNVPYDVLNRSVKIDIGVNFSISKDNKHN